MNPSTRFFVNNGTNRPTTVEIKLKESATASIVIDGLAFWMSAMNDLQLFLDGAEGRSFVWAVFIREASFLKRDKHILAGLCFHNAIMFRLIMQQVCELNMNDISELMRK